MVLASSGGGESTRWRDPKAQSLANTFLSIPYEEFAAELDGALAWIQSLGIAYKRTRIGEYKRAINKLIQIYQSADKQEANRELPRIATAAYEANDLIAVHKGLGGRFDNELRTHIKEAYGKGPVSYTQEVISTSSNRARNIAFELRVMAWLASAGIEIDFGIKTDVAARFDNRSVILECKRPQSSEAVESNVKDAFEQLEEKYRNPVRPRHRGIIAIDISKLTNPDFKGYFHPDTDSLDAYLSQRVSQFIVANEHYWQTGRDKKTIAVLVRFSSMEVNKKKGDMLTCCQHYALTPLNHSGERNIATAEALANALANVE